MTPFDTNSPVDRQVENRDLFLSRLQLMVVMSKAYLEGTPIGKHRKQAIVENADALFYMSLSAEHSGDISAIQEDKDLVERKRFYESVRLLSVMGKAFADDRLTGELKRKELQENIDYICEAITFSSRIKDIGFLHVA